MKRSLILVALFLSAPGAAQEDAPKTTTKSRNLQRRLQADTAPPELPDVDAVEKGKSRRLGPAEDQADETTEPPDSDNRDRTAAPEVRGARRVGPSAGLRVPGGLYGLDQVTADAVGDDSRPMATPELHIVKKGDTLWSLCGQYYRDPWRWPRLWAENPLITNPHWIFPGDVVRLRPTGAPVEAPRPGPVSSKDRTITTARAGSFESKAVALRQMGFIAQRDLQGSATISGSREEKIMLTTGDQAYIQSGQGDPLRAGERYTIFVADREHPVKSSQDGKVLGYLVRVYGDVMVDQMTESKMARGTLTGLTDPVERGYSVSSAIKQFKKIEPRPSGVNLEARVVASFTPATILFAGNFVVLSRGKKDGVEVGNRTFVVRRGDGFRGRLEGWDVHDPRFPKEVVGELWVVDVREDASVAWVVRTTKEIQVGEVAELRKGH